MHTFRQTAHHGTYGRLITTSRPHIMPAALRRERNILVRVVSLIGGGCRGEVY